MCPVFPPVLGVCLRGLDQQNEGILTLITGYSNQVIQMLHISLLSNLSENRAYGA